ncbi:RES family NAD+ phosphorylase [[Mycobacterium] vasticus]|uniref:RES family NAD+ phosphorylase n=1 Tax=[Mycobacterium] vasticus TaxID=2875777 RepID=A0ABU5YW01_9MYCO|nr:RES family NAD+ phosphorylase [Mycolicibacter sp. MYC017]MEB3069306.1 RES family NAD+ phosphorylase [Mycolicibacter sp. MYC017]
MSPPRGAVHLASPPPPTHLATFPAYVCPAGTEVFRSHRHGREPRWFPSSGEGRFDLAAADGTCYAAENAGIALLETWGGIRIVPDYLVAERDVSKLLVTNTVRIADLTSNGAIGFGVTSEIFTTIDYPATQRWATALHQAGFDGVRYWARHDLAHTAACLAVFGPTGAATDGCPLDTAQTDYLPDRPDLLSTFESETGIAILPVPPI